MKSPLVTISNRGLGSHSQRTGFTLVELLVVIVIISIVAALLLPAISLAKGQVRSTTCHTHLRQMGMALQMYVHENGGKYPYYLGPSGPSYGDATGQGGRAAGLIYWSSKLFPYYPLSWTNKAYHCPGYQGAITGPVFGGAPDRLGSYAYNVHGSGSAWTTGDEGKVLKRFGLGPLMTWPEAKAVSEAQVKVPSEMLAIGESQFLKTSSNDSVGGQDVLFCGLARHTFDPARHGKNYNQLFCDGHVGAMNPGILFNPTNTASMWNYDHQPHPDLWVP
jgi:prepilin-type N-terminal cleavage/methylation domain-containing protein/prepilin-type processing-associated H-X9-DG protein